MTDPFFSRMSELDALVAQCRGRGQFALGVVRDTSNRSNRDWPWWSVQIERTEEDGSERRRRIAEIRFSAPIGDMPARFEGRWTARIWYGESVDSLRRSGIRSFAWDRPSAGDLDAAMAALFAEADAELRAGLFQCRAD